MNNLKYEYGLKKSRLLMTVAIFSYAAYSTFSARNNYPEGITFFESVYLDTSQAAVLMMVISAVLALVLLINLHGLYVSYKNPNRYFELNANSLSIPHLIFPNTIKVIPFNEISSFDISSKRLVVKHKNKDEIVGKRLFKNADEFDAFVSEFSKRMEERKSTT